jgi:hypothetical protein
MTAALIVAPSQALLRAPLFAPTPRAAQCFIAFFIAQINSASFCEGTTSKSSLGRVPLSAKATLRFCGPGESGSETTGLSLRNRLTPR